MFVRSVNRAKKMCQVSKDNTDTAGSKEKPPFLMMFIIKLSLIKPLARLRRKIEDRRLKIEIRDDGFTRPPGAEW